MPTLIENLLHDRFRRISLMTSFFCFLGVFSFSFLFFLAKEFDAGTKYNNKRLDSPKYKTTIFLEYIIDLVLKRYNLKSADVKKGKQLICFPKKI